MTVINETRPVAGAVGRCVKRATDVTAATVALVLLAPVLLLIAVAIFVTSPGPTIFRQVRVGRNGEAFQIVKFRTMVFGAEEHLHSDPELHAIYLDNDHKVPAELDTRVTPLGRFLRRSSLDELPQLLNVLVGHMSLVGPRPILPAELGKYGLYQDLYLSVRPGLTGPWQAGGRSTVAYDERVAIDAQYVRNWTYWGDLKILAQTVPAVFRGLGAH